MTHFHEGTDREPQYDRPDLFAYRCPECKGVFFRKKPKSVREQQERVHDALFPDGEDM